MPKILPLQKNKMENFDLRKYLAENRLLKEEKTFNVYNDGGEPILVNLDKATPSQEKLIRWEMPNITEPETSEEAQEIANEIMQLNSVEDVKQYYGYKRGWFNSSLKTLVGDAMVVYSNLAENKFLKEEEFKLYITNVEYDTGKDGYMYQLVDAETGEENEIGFDQLHFDRDDNLLKLGVDFNDYEQTSYQEEELSAEEAMKLYNELK